MDHMNRYRASVSSAVFWSSAQSPDINKSRRTTSKSPVSKSLGRSCFRNPDTLVLSGSLTGRGLGRGGGHLCSGSGGGQGIQGVVSLNCGFGGSGCGTDSWILLRW